jgi:SSS family solute:Na+ symporter
MGAFAAVMLGAFITTNDTYLHSWGSIFVQDIVMPLRKKPFSPRQHILALRLSILGVAVFAFFFSLIFQQAEYIRLFFAITGAIFAGGAGAVIIGGLYWKRGTTRAAYAALITGAVLAVGGIACDQIHKHWVDSEIAVDGLVMEAVAEISDINGMVITLIAMCSSIGIYAAFSLIGKRKDHDMDRLLHRGKYAVAADLAGGQGASGDARGVAGAAHEAAAHEAQEERQKMETVGERIVNGIKILFGVGRDFTRTDRWICRITYAWVLAWFAVFVIGTIWNLTSDVSDEAWMTYWYVFVTVRIVAAAMVVIWFAIGGVRDIRRMFARLKTMDRDESDDGTVRSG